MTHLLVNANSLNIPLTNESVQCVITSPIYWNLRDYGVKGQLGQEPTYQEYVANLMVVVSECWRVLRSDCTLWMVIGDSYITNPGNGRGGGSTLGGGKPHLDGKNRSCRQSLKTKNLVGIPWRVAFAMQDAGWILRSDIIWNKPNAKPGSQTDRPTTSHEYVFLFSKQSRYYYDNDAIKEPAKTWAGRAATFERSGAVSEHVLPGQSVAEHRPSRNGKNSLRSVGLDRETETGKANRDGRDMSRVGPVPTRTKRSVWNIATVPYREAHFATFPPALVEPMILAGSKPGDIVLDPFSGTATVGQVCEQHGRHFIGLELNPFSNGLAKKRLTNIDR